METETRTETKSQRRFRRYRLRVIQSQPMQRCASCGDKFTARYCADLCEGCTKEREATS